MKPGKRWIFLLLCPVLLIAVFLPGGLELRLIQVDSSEPLLVLPLKPGETFCIRYYHSVENTPIWETHSVDEKGNIFIEEEKYLKFGAGMGKMPGVGRMVKKGPYEAIVDMHMPTGNFILRVGSPGVDHTIIWRDTTTNLSAIAPHKAVRFEARRVSFIHYLARRLFPHPKTPIRVGNIVTR